jgi:hypothetical protein
VTTLEVALSQRVNGESAALDSSRDATLRDTADGSLPNSKEVV